MRLRVQGKQALNGVYHPAGNSNAAQALTAAALLAEAPVTLRNMPNSASVRGQLATAERLGAALTWDGEQDVTIHASQLTRRTLSQAETDATVGALLFVAPMLIRRQYARLELDMPLSRIRTHLEAARDLGIDVVTVEGAVEFRSALWERKTITLTQASVTATALVLMLAARLGRETQIRNAACEPHIGELARLLTRMGAPVDGVGSNVLTVHGAAGLTGAEWTIAPDHVEAASVAVIAALCGGSVRIAMPASDFGVIPRIIGRLGIQVYTGEDGLFVPPHSSFSVSNREEDADSSVETAPWPGFPSDLVAVATVAATQARGTSLIHEKMFNNRLLFVDKLKAMGAQIVLCDPHRVIVVGASPLRGIYMDSPDVRAGLGMLTAALVAQGESIIDNAQVIEQTFAGTLVKLRGLNAAIEIE